MSQTSIAEPVLPVEKIKAEIRTYGCKVNTYDTGLLQTRLLKSGIGAVGTSPQNSARDVVIFNTCAVTAEATREALRDIRKVKSKNPDACVVVTGCGAQVDTDQFRDLAAADLVVANSHKGDLENLIRKHLRGELSERVFHSNIFRKEDLEEGGGKEAEHTRAFLKIQDGCNSFCTYCVIPFARGKSRSIPIDDLVRRIKELTADGVREVVLTGVHIGDYEDWSLKTGGARSLIHDARARGDLARGLEDLVENVLLRTSIERIRLSSLEPVEVTDRLLNLYADTRLCPHFHMSIQSAQDDVLKGMRRNYRAADVEFALNRIAARIPNVYVGMDVIVGFPQETDEQFSATYELLARLPWTRLHVFPYSQRPGTKAAVYPQQVSNLSIHTRARRLRELSHTRFIERARAQVGREKQILLLNQTKGLLPGQRGGLSEDYWPVVLENTPGGIKAPAGSSAPIAIVVTGILEAENVFQTRLLARALPDRVNPSK